MKIAALMVGPTGIGVIGLLQSLMATASAVASLGFGPAGTRQIAQATGRNDEFSVSLTRRALFLGTLFLALMGGSIFWAIRNILAERIFDDPSLSNSIGWLATGIALTVASGSQGALLNGLQRIGDLARVTIGTALFSTVIGTMSLIILGDRGLLIFVLATPVSSFFIGHWYVSKIQTQKKISIPLTKVVKEFNTIARLGAALMIAGALWSIGHLVVRTYIQREMGSVSLGYFLAAWTIGTTYLGVVLSALGTDYLPRLSAVISNHLVANRVINEQSEVVLLLAGPILLAMLGLAPWVIELLYSKEFIAGVDLLRWQVLADVIKIVMWPLSYCILAAGNGRIYLATEAIAVGIFIGITYYLLPIIGIEAAGVSFLAIFIFLLPVNYYLAWRRTGFHWSRRVLAQAIGLAITSCIVFVAGSWSTWIGAGCGILSSLAFGIYGLARIGHMTDLPGRLGKTSEKIRKFMNQIGA